MIVVYTSPGCASCRKVKQWLKDRNMEFIEKNIFKTVLNDKEIKTLFERTENGTDDLVSKRSKIIQEQKVDVDSMTMNELVKFIRENPSILKRPIIISENNFQVGYDEEEISTFVPARLRGIADLACNNTCPNYDVCKSVRKTEE